VDHPPSADAGPEGEPSLPTDPQKQIDQLRAQVARLARCLEDQS
jgi:hypothetical protein